MALEPSGGHSRPRDLSAATPGGDGGLRGGGGALRPGGSLGRENPGEPARPIRAWQVWNEPSLKVYWGGRPNARAYVRLRKAVNGAIKRLDPARSMDRGGDRRAGIWITGLGWFDNGPRHRFCVGSAKQAGLTRNPIALIRRNRTRLRLRGFVYYTWRDATPYAPEYRDQWGLHTGLIELNGRPKPALLGFLEALKGLV